MQPGRSVTSKVLGIMAAFEALHPPVSVNDLAEHASLPLSTTHRLVGELADWGALEHDRNGGIHLGSRLTSITATAAPSMRQLLLPHLEELCAVTQNNVSLGLRDGDQVRSSERCYGHVETRRATPVGSRLPLHATAMGKTLLAHAADWYQEAYLSRELGRPGESNGSHGEADELEPEVMADELWAIRQSGYALSRHPIAKGVETIAVPVYHLDHLTCSMDLIRPSGSAIPNTRFYPALRATASAMQAELDHFQSLPIWETASPAPP